MKSLGVKVPHPNAETFARLQAMLSNITGNEPEDISMGMDFDELAMSPMELAQLLAEISHTFGTKVTRDDLDDVGSVGELAAFIDDEIA